MRGLTIASLHVITIESRDNEVGIIESNLQAMESEEVRAESPSRNVADNIESPEIENPYLPSSEMAAVSY